MLPNISLLRHTHNVHRAVRLHISLIRININQSNRHCASSRTLDFKPLASSKEKDHTTPKKTVHHQKVHTSYQPCVRIMQKQDHACQACRKQATVHRALVYIHVNCTVRVHRTAEHSKQHRAATLQQSIRIISMQSAQCTTNKIVQLHKSQTKSATQCERERA